MSSACAVRRVGAQPRPLLLVAARPDDGRPQRRVALLDAKARLLQRLEPQRALDAADDEIGAHRVAELGQHDLQPAQLALGHDGTARGHGALRAAGRLRP